MRACDTGLKFAGKPQNLVAAFATSKNDKFFKALDGYFALDPMDERGYVACFMRQQ